MNKILNASVSKTLVNPTRKRAYNINLFTEAAPRYNIVTRALSLGRDRAWKEHLIRCLPAISHPRIIDLACGTGDISRLLAKRYPQGHISAIDITPSMLTHARKQSSHANIDFIEADINHLPFDDGSFDIVTGGYALRNAPDLVCAIREIERVLKPGGVAVFLDFSKSPYRFSQWISCGILKIWGGLWGILLHGQAKVYTYIADSLRLFPPRPTLHKQFKGNQLEVVTSRRFCFGLIEIFMVKKRI